MNKTIEIKKMQYSESSIDRYDLVVLWLFYGFNDITLWQMYDPWSWFSQDMFCFMFNVNIITIIHEIKGRLRFGTAFRMISLCTSCMYCLKCWKKWRMLFIFLYLHCESDCLTKLKKVSWMWDSYRLWSVFISSATKMDWTWYMW